LQGTSGQVAGRPDRQAKKGTFLQRRGVFSLDLSREIPKDSEAYFTGTRPLMGGPFTRFNFEF